MRIYNNYIIQKLCQLLVKKKNIRKIAKKYTLTSCHTIVLASRALLIASMLAMYWFSSSSYLLDILCRFMYSPISGLLPQQSKGTSSPPRWRYWSGNTCTISENKFRIKLYSAGEVGFIGPNLPFGFPEESDEINWYDFSKMMLIDLTADSSICHSTTNFQFDKKKFRKDYKIKNVQYMCTFLKLSIICQHF